MAHLLGYDSNGNIIASFDTDLNSAAQIADFTTIPVTDDQWTAWCNDKAGWIVANGVLTAVVESPAQLLADAQSAQSQTISIAAGAQVNHGFKSSALGASYSYPLDLVSQSNMQAAVIRMGMTQPPPPATINYMCADANGVWVRRPHNATQMTQAALDGMAYVEAVLAKKDSLTAQIQAATTVAAVQAITWSFP